VNWSEAATGLVPPAVVTRISTVPVDPTGEVAVIWVAEFTEYAAAAVLPNATAVASVNPVPVIVTDVPPAVEPEDGETDVTDGTGA